MATAILALGAWAITRTIAMTAVEPADDMDHDISAVEDEQPFAAMRGRFGG